LNTGATILRALLGTVIGLVAGGLLVALLGSDETALWIVLPFAAMLAAYAPRAVSFAAGQAGFTVLILVLFNLLAPGGWKVGLVRLEDVAIGFAISLVMGLLLWPRGAADVLRRALDDALTTSAGYTAAAARRLGLGVQPVETRDAAATALAAAGRLDIAVRQRLAEHSGDPLRVTSLAGLTGASSRLRFAGGVFEVLAANVGDAPRPTEGATIAREAGRVADWYARLGDSVAARVPPPAGIGVPTQLEDTLLDATRDGYASGSRAQLLASMAMVWAGLHLEVLHGLEERAATAAATLDGPES
jgi:hypothetical protein